MHNLFVALFPADAVLPLLARRAAELCETHRLKGRLRPVTQLHVTLGFLGRFPDEVPGPLLDSARQACARAAAAGSRFEVTLDHAHSFRGRPRRHPFVLAAGERSPGLFEFQQRLAAELETSGFPLPPGQAFRPHLTLLYAKSVAAAVAIEPIHWTAGEIVLVDSHVGQGRYEKLGSWPLGV